MRFSKFAATKQCVHNDYYDIKLEVELGFLGIPFVVYQENPFLKYMYKEIDRPVFALFYHKQLAVWLRCVGCRD